MDSLTQNCGGLLIRTFSLRTTDTKLDPFWCFFLMTEGEILISVDTDGFLDPKLWGRGGWLIHTFSLGQTDYKLDPFWCFFLMAEGEILISR